MKDVYPYTPRKTSHQNLERYFIARHDLFNELQETLITQAGAKAIQHWMIIGARGLGKSHLVALLYHQIKQAQNLRAKWIPLLMLEEEQEVYSLATLLARITTVLAEEIKAEDPEQSMEVLNYIDHLRKKAPSSKDLYEDLLAYLKDFSNNYKKRLVVFLENTDDLFTKSLKTDLEIKTFRNLLLHETFILFISTSPTFFERINRQNEPLYGLFRIRHLELLDFDQSMELMRRWADASENSSMLKRLQHPDFRLRVLYHLTGGNPRLLLFLYLTLSGPEEMESATEAFGRMLEHDLTGFYLSRMKDIPEQQKPIIMSLAKSRTNLTQKEIAEQTFLPLTSMGTHINRLEKSGLVRAFTKKAGKNTLYGLTDQLFRLWNQWRSGWREKEVIQALVEFLAIWYRRKELSLLAEGKGMYAQYAGQALKFRLEDDFRSRLELVYKEGITDFKKHLQQGNYDDIFPLIESLEDFGMEQEPLIDEIERKLFQDGPDASTEELLFEWENRIAEGLEGQKEAGRKDLTLNKIKNLKKLVSIAKGRPIKEIAIKEINDGDLSLLIGNFKFEENDLSGAEDAYQRSVELDPKNAKAWAYLGATRVMQDNYSGAEEAVQRVVELGPKIAIAWAILGSTRGMQKNYSGAEEAYQHVVELDPKSAEGWANLGNARYNQDNYSGAEEAYQHAVELDPKSAEGWANLGGARYNQEYYSGAEEAYQHAVELDPKNAEAWANLGDARYNQEYYSGAEEAYQRTVELDPKNAKAWSNLGTALGMQDNYSGAEEAYQHAVELDPKDAETWANLGLARYNQEYYSGAEESYQHAVELDPNNPIFLTNLGGVLFYQENYPSAEKIAQQIIDLVPKDTKAWANLGSTRGRQDNHSGAEEAFQHAVKLDPTNAKAWENLGIAQSYQENYIGAERAFGKAVTIKKDLTSSWLNLGITCYNQWKLEKSHNAILKAIALNPQDFKSYSILAIIHVVSHGRLAALEMLEKSLKNKKIMPHLRAGLYLLKAMISVSEENKSSALQAMQKGKELIDKSDPAEKEQRQSIIAELMDSLRKIILPETWAVADTYLNLLSQAAPQIYEIIGRLQHVIRYFKILEFEQGGKTTPRKEAAAQAQRILDRLPSEERVPIEEMIKEVEKNIKNWRKAANQNKGSKMK